MGEVLFRGLGDSDVTIIGLCIALFVLSFVQFAFTLISNRKAEKDPSYIANIIVMVIMVIIVVVFMIIAIKNSIAIISDIDMFEDLLDYKSETSSIGKTLLYALRWLLALSLGALIISIHIVSAYCIMEVFIIAYCVYCTIIGAYVTEGYVQALGLGMLAAISNILIVLLKSGIIF